MAEPAPRASVIIPNWNGLHLLRPCLDALARQTWRDFEVIVVDNASSDGSAEAVRREYPQVRILAEARNHGYAAGCNLGVAMARGSVLVLLNNDTVPEPDWLGELIAALDRHPEAGSAASRIVIHDRPSILHSAGDLYGRNGIPESRGVWQVYAPPYDQECPVFGGCGAAVAYRREVIQALGGFEPAFFMYCEDVDLAWRAQLAGWTCVYAPRAVVRHHLSATGGGTLASYYVGRNTIWVIARNYPWTLLKRHWPAVLGAQWRIAREALRAWRGAAARARLKGQLVGLLTWPRWLAARRAIQRTRRVGDEYLESILD
ncbi:MAG: glycosyltransferase family 2 protein [Chloroflexi bacterium]|nr:glycosyltransferase family 2 protein [Chloroflexota bacterium]